MIEYPAGVYNEQLVHIRAVTARTDYPIVGNLQIASI